MPTKAQHYFQHWPLCAGICTQRKSSLSIALPMLKGKTDIDRNRKLISYKERKLRNNLRKAIKVGDSGYPEQSGSGTKQRQ